MKSRFLTSLAGAAVALFFVCGLTFAKANNVNLIYRGEIGSNLTLSPGQYHVVINNHSAMPEASFYQNGKLVGTAPVKMVAESRKNDQTEVYYSAPHNNLRRITQMDFSGWKDKLIFGRS